MEELLTVFNNCLTLLMVAIIIGSLAAGVTWSPVRSGEFVLSWCLPFTMIPVPQVADSIGGWFDLCFVMWGPIGLKDN